MIAPRTSFAIASIASSASFSKATATAMVELQGLGTLKGRVSIFHRGQRKLGSMTDGSTLSLLFQLLLTNRRIGNWLGGTVNFGRTSGPIFIPNNHGAELWVRVHP